ncbi:prephenate/arogenate dehydrogenase family protein [Luteithermobacter gelatinilyticus]|uniref:prephenate/arogenate dehydrogenase family protein n=1 Tax=Luteithermobacter gelatinilyticus TaxID=2582913 RepID=UPI0011060FCD|nr:prephenate/arogenate dehydrogenase family protein [Luteithermobacter gelatinilyticus]
MTLYKHVTIIGFGLIGSSVARALRENGLCETIVACDQDAACLKKVEELHLADRTEADPAKAVLGADLVMLATPVGTFGPLAKTIGPHLDYGATVTDVGSVKGSVVRALRPHMPPHVHVIPGHPVAGTEQSGPEAGFASLFFGRWCILTPPEDVDETALTTLKKMWEAFGSTVEIMTPEHHDLVLAITSHIPHLIAYNIVGTAHDLEGVTDSEVIKFSAGGFRDFTRIAASDPTMWRDVFLHNKEAVLEMLGRFTEDLTALQRAIRWGDGDKLFKLFSHTRAIRKQIIEAGQDDAAPDFGREHDIPKNNMSPKS